MNVRHLKDVRPMQEKLTCPYIKKCFIETVSMSDGKVIFHLEVDQKYYYELLSEWMGMPVKGDYAFYRILRQLSENQTAYSAVSQAVESARAKGYGVVAPEKLRCFWSLRCSLNMAIVMVLRLRQRHLRFT